MPASGVRKKLVEVALPLDAINAAAAREKSIRHGHPFADVDVPLASTFMLSTKKGKEAYVEPVIEGREYRFGVSVGAPPDLDTTKAGTEPSRGCPCR